METDWKFILQKTNTKFYCGLCRCDVFSRRNVQDHYNGKKHTRNLELYGYDISHKWKNQYMCHLCECNISGYLNVYIHVMGRKHQNLLNESESETSEDNESESETSEDNESESESSEESCEYVAMNAQDFIVLNYDTDMLECILCNLDITNNSFLLNHLSGQTHKKAVETYGCHIFKSRTTWYYCKLCDCEISSFKNVYPHITGRQHTNFLY